MASQSLEALLNQIRQLQQGAPYDAQLGSALQNAQYRMSDLDRQYDKSYQSLQSSHQNTERELGKQKEQGLATNADRYADSGMLHSGIFAGAQGKIGEQYQSALQNAIQRKLAGENELTEYRRSGESEIQNMLQGVQSDYARRQQEAAQNQALLQAQRQAQEQQNALAAQQAAQNQAILRAMQGEANASGGGGGAPGAAPSPYAGYTGSTGGSRAPGTGELIQHDPSTYDQGFWAAAQAYGPAGGYDWLTKNSRPGGYTQDQVSFLNNYRRQQVQSSKNLL